MKWRTALTGLIAAGAISPLSVSAGYLQHTLSLHLGVEYDSNPELDPDSSDAVTRVYATPALSIAWSKPRDVLRADLSARLERSSDECLSGDRSDPHAAVSWVRQLPRGQTGLRASYSESPPRISELEESGAIESDGTRKSMTVNGHWQHALSELTWIALSAGYGSNKYDGGTHTDYDTISASGTLSRKLSDRTKFSTTLSAARNEPAGSVEDNSVYSGVLSVDWAMSERLELSLHGGGSKLSELSSLNWQGGLNAVYRLEHGDVTLAAGRSVTTGALGDFTRADFVRLSLTHAFGERSRMGADAQWREVHGDRANTLQQGGVWFGYRINPYISLRLNYRYLMRDIRAGSEASANILDLSLSFARTQ